MPNFCIFLPAKIFILAVSILKIISKVLSWFDINVLKGLLSVLDTNVLAPYVGFKGGITPISSWQNFGLYFLMLGMALIFLLPTITMQNIKFQKVTDFNQKLAIRLRAGDILSKFKKVATAILFIIILLTVFSLIHVPFSVVLKFVVLLCLGIIFGIDNLIYSDDGKKYGLAPFNGKRKASEALAEELGIGTNELAKNN